MKKRLLSLLLVLALALPLLSIGGIINVGAHTDLTELKEKILQAKSVMYNGYSEQSRKYLYDRIERAEALMYSPAPSEADAEAVLSELQNAIDSLAPMHAFESIPLNGFNAWSEASLSEMKESVGVLTFDTDTKPEGVDFSVKVSSDKDSAVLSNGNGDNAIFGASVFDKDMLKADGIKLWISSDTPTSFSISIGVKGESSAVFSIDEIHMHRCGYFWLPFDAFSGPEGVSVPKDGSLNYIRIENIYCSSFFVADLNAYNEILESGKKTQYSETLVSSRSEIENNAYYKIIEVSTGKAVTLGPEVDETSIRWDRTIGIEDNALNFTLEDNVEGDRTQMWQLADSQAGDSTFLIINKSSSNAITINSGGGSISAKELNLTNEYQRWSISLTAKKATIQIRGVGKLTAAGNTVKATPSSSFKKFYLYKVVETEYVESWSDEFDGDELDRTKWNVVDGYSDGAIYPDDEELLSVENGNLISIGKTERYDAYELVGTYMNTSGKFAFGYGKIEVRAKFAYGTGQFPAFWLMPSDMMNMGAGEVDIFEMVVQDNIDANGEIIGTVHWTNDEGTEDWAKVHYLKMFGHGEDTLSSDFHTFGLELDRDQIRYYYDGIQYMSLLYNSDGKKFAFGDTARYIIFNNTPRGDTSNIVNEDWGVEDEYKIEVDYIKVFLENGEMTDETEDYTTEESTNYSEGLDAVVVNDYWDVNLPTDIKPDGTEGASADHINKLYIFDPITNVTKKVINFSPLVAALRLQYSPDGKHLALATTKGCIYIYDTSDYDKEPVKIYNGAVIQENVLFSKDSKSLIVGGFNGGSQSYKNPITGEITEKWCFRVFDVETGAKLQEINVGSDPRFIALSDDGTKLSVGTTSNGVFVYNALDWTQIAHFTDGHLGAVRGVDFSSDGNLLVTSDDRGVINLWDLTTNTLYKTVNNVNTGSVRRVIFSPDDKNILATSAYGAARLFDVESGELISLLGGFGNIVRDVAYSPDGKYIVVASYEGGVKVFSANGTYLETLKAGEVDANEEGYIVSGIRFSPDSKHVFFATRTYPNGLQKWALPAEVDKTMLKAAIADADPSVDGYDHAVKVAGLKYASADTVSDAYYKLVAPSEEVNTALVSVDGYNFSDNAAVFKNGIIYLKASTPARYTNLAVKLTATDGTSTVYGLDDAILLSETVSADYSTVERFLKLYMYNGGEYTVGLVDTLDNTEFATVSVSVDPVKITTDDFLYEIKNGSVTITYGISGDRNVNIPDYIEGYPVTVIGKAAFKGYGRTVSGMTVTLPSTLKRIEDEAFYSCSSLRSIKFPESLESIGNAAFRDCKLLGDISFHSGLEIDSYAFRGTGIGTVTIANGVRTDSTVFNGNYRVRELILEKGVEKFNSTLGTQYLFESIYVPESVTELSASFTYSSKKDINVYGVPGSYAETFAASNPEKYTFVPLAAPVISGVEEGATYDLYTIENELLPDWDVGPIATLNGEKYRKGQAITEPGEYTLKIVNGYDEYASEVSFTVVDTTPPPYVLGDVDSDGEVTIADALAALRIAAKLTQPEGNQALAADIDKDGSISVADALAILRYVAKLIENL